MAKADEADEVDIEIPQGAPLKDRMARFVQEYPKDCIASEAAIRAGYSKKTAAQIAYRLMRRPDVRQAIQKAMAEHAKALGLGKSWVLIRLKSISDRCMGLEPAPESFDPAGATRATELIGKHLKMFTDKHEVSGPDGGPIEVADAKARLAERLSRLAPRPDPGGTGDLE